MIKQKPCPVCNKKFQLMIRCELSEYLDGMKETTGYKPICWPCFRKDFIKPIEQDIKALEPKAGDLDE